MTAQPRTVWLASYPKSGNTWVRALLTGLDKGEELDINRLGHGPIASAREPVRHWLGIPSSEFTPDELGRLRALVDAELNATLTEVRFRKVHDALFTGPDGAAIVPAEATLGAIYIVRDPRDVAVSLAHHMGIEVAKSVALMGDPAGAFRGSARHNGPQLPQALGTWSEHVRGWCEHELFPVLVVRYEDLHADPVGELTRIVRFAELGHDAEAIATAVRVAQFSRLAAKEAEEGFSEHVRDAKFFRRGGTQTWREELDPELARQVEEDHAETMQELGYALEVAHA